MNETGQGLAEQLRRAAERALELARVRLELLGVELQAELLRLFAALSALLLALLLGAAALLMLCFALLLWAPPPWQAPLGLAMGLLFLLGAGMSWRWARQRLAEGQPFAASLSELARDGASLRGDD
jgi:uncharacterized membrane protein YqjE